MKSRWLQITAPALVAVLSLTPAGALRAQEIRPLLDLRGEWKFELGDDVRWADPKFDDDKWTEIAVPSPWEDQGYPGYDGYAWYRKHFNLPTGWESKDIVLELGTIDDVDETYLNGQFLDYTGEFPPHYMTAYSMYRRYPVPHELLVPGDNVIAVRVYDNELSGGITQGRIGLFERKDVIRPDIALPAAWKFTTGDDAEWKEPGFNDHSWKEVRVPAHWETQGFKGYDGYGWYRVRFNVPPGYQDQDMILLLGRIDDFDETYLNGERIGKTGTMPRTEMHYTSSNDYLQLRAYTIPAGRLKPGEENVLAVKVFDVWLGGGIYDGPIGIVTRGHYMKFKRTSTHFDDWVRDLIDFMFH